MVGPGDDDELFLNREGDEVPWDDLSEAEQDFHQSEQTSLTIDDYCQTWGQDGFNREIDDEAFDKDSD